MKLADRYAELLPLRQPYLERGRACAALTVPSTCPPQEQSYATPLPKTSQSFGARAPINLAAKLLMALLPPGTSSFNLTPPASLVLQSGSLDVDPELKKNLTKCELLINSKVETLNWRRPTYNTLLHLIIAGNIAEYITPKGRIKQWRLEQYVCVRDWDGAVIEIVAAEKMKVRSLPWDLKTIQHGKKEDDDVTLYTRFERVSDDKYKTSQDLDDINVLAEAEQDGLMPANALAWDLVPGEHYGRSHVEANYSDLLGLDETSKQIRESGAIAARNLIFVAPNAAGGNLRKRIAQARNGDVLSGRGGPTGDVQPFQFNNSQAIQTMSAEKQDLMRGLAAAFLMTGDLRRDAERVTATELRMLASEIETSLGGVYSLLAVELQAWRIRSLMAIMARNKELPEQLNSVEVEVTTGLEALGKDAQVNKARALFSLMNEVPQAFQESAAKWIDFPTILTPTVAALGFPGSIKSSDQVAKEDAQQQQAAMAQSVVDKAAGPVATAMAQPTEA